MGLATLDGRPFRLDPSSISWNFKIKTADTPTVGGKVVQVYGTRLDDMTVTGSFGRGGWQAQAAFLQRMKEIGLRQAEHPELGPVRFLFPQLQLDFAVFLLGYSNEDGGSRSVRHSAGIFNPTWSLKLMIAQDHTAGLKEAATSLFIRRIAKGMGWEPNIYSGPLSWDDVAETIAPYSLQEYLTLAFEPAAAAAVGATLPTASGSTVTPAGSRPPGVPG